MSGNVWLDLGILVVSAVSVCLLVWHWTGEAGE